MADTLDKHHGRRGEGEVSTARRYEMIYHRFGSVVKEIHSFDENTGEVSVSFEDDRPGVAPPSTMHVSELKADKGIHEIVAGCKGTGEQQ